MPLGYRCEDKFAPLLQIMFKLNVLHIDVCFKVILNLHACWGLLHSHVNSFQHAKTYYVMNVSSSVPLCRREGRKVSGGVWSYMYIEF